MRLNSGGKAFPLYGWLPGRCEEVCRVSGFVHEEPALAVLRSAALSRPDSIQRLRWALVGRWRCLVFRGRCKSSPRLTLDCNKKSVEPGRWRLGGVLGMDRARVAVLVGAGPLGCLTGRSSGLTLRRTPWGWRFAVALAACRFAASSGCLSSVSLSSSLGTAFRRPWRSSSNLGYVSSRDICDAVVLTSAIALAAAGLRPISVPKAAAMVVGR